MSPYHQCFFAYMLALALGLLAVLVLQHIFPVRKD